MFLIKTAFWLCVIIMLVPIGMSPADDNSRAGAGQSTGISTQAAGVARATVSDMASFCDRNPEVCQTGTKVLDKFRAKAIVVAAYVFDVISGTPSQTVPSPKTRQPIQADVNDPVKRPPLVRSLNTLAPSDLETPWVGPKGGDA